MDNFVAVEKFRQKLREDMRNTLFNKRKLKMNLTL